MPIRPTAPLRPPAAHPWVLLLLLLLAAAARASDQSHAALTAVEPAVYATLRECLQNSGVEFVTPADKGYLAARQVYTSLQTQFPAAVAFPKSEAEIMAIVECAAQHGVRVHSRCGGHGNQGETVATGDVTVDLNKHMRGVKLSPDKKTVVVKAGARIGQLLADLFEQSNGTRGFPGGQRPDVGVAGYSLGGGFGGATRFAGLASDNIIAIRAVVYRNFTAQVVVADATQNGDLLWAARGAGGGDTMIVTEFTFRTMDISTGLTQWDITFPPNLVNDMLTWYFKWVPTLPNRFTPKIEYDVIEEGTPKRQQVTMSMLMYCIGNIDDCTKAIDPKGLPPPGSPLGKIINPATIRNASENGTTLAMIVKNVGGGMSPPTKLSVLDAFRDIKTFTNYERMHKSFYWFKSILLSDTAPLNAAGVDILLKWAASTGLKSPPNTVFEIQSLGGAMKDVPREATSSLLHDATHVLIMRIGLQQNSGPVYETAMAQLNNASRAQADIVNTFPRKAADFRSYVNFIDSDIALLSSDWEKAYYGASMQPLLCINEKFDPSFILDHAVYPLHNLLQDGPGVKASQCTGLVTPRAAAAQKWSATLLKTAPLRL